MSYINTTRDLLNRIKSGDKNSFGDFFRMYYEKFVRVALLYVRGYNNAEDIASEVFIKLLNRIDRLEKIDRIEAYLFRMVKNQCLDFLKKKDNRSLVLVDEYEEHFFSENSDLRIEIEGNELQEIIVNFVEQLPPKRKIVYQLIKEDNLTYKEVAEILNVSPKTIDSHLALTLKSLRLVITNYYSDRDVITSVRSIKSSLK